ncbi:MAG: molybdopterin-guanine dinucleotide biosynthesis protein B, partial [Candidatus Hadarchaeaceae archaeon]
MCRSTGKSLRKAKSLRSTCSEVSRLLRTIVIAGRKNSGKTKVIEGLVKELTSRGYSVGTVKHVPKQGFTLDQSGTDTWRHAQ